MSREYFVIIFCVIFIAGLIILSLGELMSKNASDWWFHMISTGIGFILMLIMFIVVF